MHAISNHMVNAIPKNQILFPEICHTAKIGINLLCIRLILRDSITIDHIQSTVNGWGFHMQKQGLTYQAVRSQAQRIIKSLMVKQPLTHLI